MDGGKLFSYLRDEEVEEPGEGGADAADAGAQVHGRDLAGVQEGDAEEAEDVDEVVEIEEEDGALERAFVVRVGDQPRQARHADGHAGGAAEHQLAAAEAVDGEGADDGAEDNYALGCGGEDLGLGGAEAEIDFVDGRGVVGDRVDAGHLKEDLDDDGQHDAVERSLAAHAED